DSWVIPLIFLFSIGMAIIWNLGSNIFLGEISFITKALAAVLQLAVTMDYSIFLWHSYEEQREKYTDKNEAMAHAIAMTITSVIGSSITTVAGFIALCFMTFTLGLDLGIVMAKGVLLGVVGCITTLPALILVFDKPI
ncbi:MAG: MMPL family transporter, partial [Eubacterium sp.]